jgi:hypothetical protein
LTKTCTVILHKCAEKYLHRLQIVWNDAPCSRLQYFIKVLSNIQIVILNILQSYEHLWWQVFMPNIGFAWESRADAPDPASLLLQVQIGRKTIVIGIGDPILYSQE